MSPAGPALSPDVVSGHPHREPSAMKGLPWLDNMAVGTWRSQQTPPVARCAFHARRGDAAADRGSTA